MHVMCIYMNETKEGGKGRCQKKNNRKNCNESPFRGVGVGLG